MNPITCAFNNCEYRYFAIKETSQGPVKQKLEWKKVDDNYHRFDESNQASYASLVIETKFEDYDQKVTEEIECKICLSKKLNECYISLTKKSINGFSHVECLNFYNFIELKKNTPSI